MTGQGREPEEVPLEGFINLLGNIHENIDDRGLAFVLGAGASVSSGIPSGARLVEEWLTLIRDRYAPAKSDLDSWATEAKVGISGFDFQCAAEFYPEVFERCYRQDPDSGYADLERRMDGKEPGLGYAALARLLADTKNRIVVTTNFDNLVADALAIYSRKQPLIVGHESLAGFVRGQLRRPLIAKIHRDLLMEPRNAPEGVGKLAAGWESALRRVFEYHTPLVIGYGGNDGSLMDFFEDLEYGKIKGCFYWCLYRDEEPSSRIKRVMERHGGFITRIPGFDEFMLRLAVRLLGSAFSVPGLARDIEERARERANRFRKLSERGQKAAGKELSVQRAFVPEVRDTHDWWSWELAINALDDTSEQEDLYRRAVDQLPESPELVGNFAWFLAEKRKDYDEAERLYRRALELDPDNAINTGNFASFLETKRKDYDEAERLYRRALELDPNDVDYYANLGSLLLRRDQTAESAALLETAWRLSKSETSQTTGEILLNMVGLSLAQERDPTTYFSRLKFLFKAGFLRLPWQFDGLYAWAGQNFDGEQVDRLRRVGDAILDESRLATLDSDPWWRAIKPVLLDEPLPGYQNN